MWFDSQRLENGRLANGSCWKHASGMGAHIRSREVSPEPPPCWDFKRRVIWRVSRQRGAGLAPLAKRICVRILYAIRRRR